MNEDSTEQNVVDARQLISQARTSHRLGSAIEYVCDTLERMIAWKDDAEREIERLRLEIKGRERHLEHLMKRGGACCTYDSDWNE